MDVVAGLLVLAVIAYAVSRALSRPPPGRATTRSSADATPHRDASTSAEDERARRRREDAADAAFIDGVLFSHYFLDHDGDREADPHGFYGDGEHDDHDEYGYDEYGDPHGLDGHGDLEDAGWEDDVFDDDFGDW